MNKWMITGARLLPTIKFETLGGLTAYNTKRAFCGGGADNRRLNE